MNRILSIIMLVGLLMAWQDISAQTDKYRLSYRDDPSTSMTIGWSGANGEVYYDVVDHGTNWASYANTQGVDRTTAHRGMSNHFVRLSNLQPETVYYFVIKDFNNNVSDRFSFMTLSNDPTKPISFIGGGDSRQGVWPAENCNCRQSRQDGNALVAKIRPDFIAFNGDYVRALEIPFVSDGEEEWQDWMDDWQLTIADDGRMFPLIPTVGNHETDEDVDKLFDVPDANIYYAIDFGGGLFRMYSLNSETDACTDVIQKAWFTNDLQQHSTASNSPEWKIVQYHIPMIPQAEYTPRQDMIDCWAPLYEQYDVRLVLESHTHAINTSYPLVQSNAPGNHEGFIRNDTTGAVFTGGGTWGAPLRTPYNAFSTTRDVGAFDSYFYIRVQPDSIRVQTVLFQNINNVATATDDEQGSELPSGAMIWAAANDAGDFYIVKYDTSATTDVVEVGAEDAPKIGATLAPNPTDDFVTIMFKNGLPEDVRIEVYNGRGQKCQSIQNVTDENYRLDVSNLCSGVNFINIITEDDVESHKLIIAR